MSSIFVYQLIITNSGTSMRSFLRREKKYKRAKRERERERELVIQNSSEAQNDI